MKTTRLNQTKIILLFTFFLIGACDSFQSLVTETKEGYQLKEGQNLIVELAVPLSSNASKRGDTFSTRLTKDVISDATVILPKNTEIRGLVTQVDKWIRFGDRARLLLTFDQIVLKNGLAIPLAASLDTRKGSRAIRIKGKDIQDAKVVGTGAIIGALAGKTVSQEGGAEKGILIGAAVGTGAVFLSNAKAVNLPAGTEIIIRLDAPLIIPK